MRILLIGGYSLENFFINWRNGGKSKCIIYFLKEECHRIFDLHFFHCAVHAILLPLSIRRRKLLSFQVYFQHRWAHVPTMPSHTLCPPLLDFDFVFPITAFQGSRSCAQLSSKFCFDVCFVFLIRTFFSDS